MRKWWLAASGVALAGLIVGTLLWSPSTPEEVNEGQTKGSNSSTSATEAVASAPTASGGSKTLGSAAGTTNTTKNRPGTPSANGAPAPRPAGDVAVADKGDKLEAIDQAPDQTLAFLSPKTNAAGATYAVTFQVYGFGPGPESDPTVVVKMTSATLKSGKKITPDLTGRNALLHTSTLTKGGITEGGSYTGVVELKQQQQLLALFLTSYAQAGK